MSFRSAPLPMARPDRGRAVTDLVVAVEHLTDLQAVREAAGRARLEGRPLVVVAVLPPWPITIDAAGHAVHARHRDALRATLLGEAVQHCAGVQQVYVETVTRPRALTAERSDRALRRRVAAVTRPDAELHPGSAGRTAPLLEALT